MGCAPSSKVDTQQGPTGDQEAHIGYQQRPIGDQQRSFDDQQGPVLVPRKQTPSPDIPTPPLTPSPSPSPIPFPREPIPPPGEETPPIYRSTPPPRELTPQPAEDLLAPRSRVVGNYVLSDVEIYEYFLDLRERPTDLDKDYSIYPTRLPFIDDDFGLHKAIQGDANKKLEWKRPREFLDNPVLISSGTTRFDVGQGHAGTCWFLAMLAVLADRPDLLKRTFQKDAWNPEHGTFTCYFWRYGEWEPVIIDDYLPVKPGNKVWGARSRDDPNELWPALLEKAIARFHGSYNAVRGGRPENAFLTVTGGYAEVIDFGRELEADAWGSKMEKARAVHRRIANACQCGALLTSGIPRENHNKELGLVGGHAYSVTGATTVRTNDGRTVYLVRLRNPWGFSEWKGPWKDGGSEWSTVSENALRHVKKNDGEFWTELKDFIKYYEGVVIGSVAPDFDKDGCSETLHFCTTIFGDWVGKKAAGFKKRIENPKYLFHLPDGGMDEEGFVPVIVQLCQKMRHKTEYKFAIRVDLFKVVGLLETGDEPTAVVELLQKGKVVKGYYKRSKQTSFRHRLEPGYYIAVPSTLKAGKEKEFLIRLFTPGPLQDVRELDWRYNVIERKPVNPPNVRNVESLRPVSCEFGKWVRGHNAGGEISKKTFYTNPFMEFEVHDKGRQEMVSLALLQKPGRQQFPIGIRVYRLNSGYDIPHGDPDFQRYLIDNFRSCPDPVDGGRNAFIIGSEASVIHELPAGRYFAILHMDKETQSTNFALIIRSSASLTIRKHNWE